MFLAQLHHTQVGVDGCAEGVSPAAAEVEGNQPCLNVSLDNLHKLFVVNFVVKLFLDVAIRYRSFVINVL
jgi:hypothetical protein